MTEAGLDIRAAEAGDLAELLNLYQHLTEGDERPSMDAAVASLARLRALAGSAVLIGRVDGQMLASCTLVVIPNITRGGKPYALIENVVTHEAARGRGHGKAMLGAAVERAWQHDCYKVMLGAAVERAWQHDCYKVMLLTGSENPATHAFYRAAGFEQSKTGFQVRRLAKRPETPPARLQAEAAGIKK